jgi:hypothetical protein
MSERKNGTETANLIAAVTWWRDYAMSFYQAATPTERIERRPESPYPALTYGVPMPPPGVTPDEG